MHNFVRVSEWIEWIIYRFIHPQIEKGESLKSSYLEDHNTLDILSQGDCKNTTRNMLTNSTCWVLEGNLYSSFTIHLYTKDVWNAMYFMRQITYQLIAGIQPSKVTNGFLINPPNAQNTPQWKRTYMIEKDRYHASKHQKCYVLTVTACVFVRYRCNLSVFVCVRIPAPSTCLQNRAMATQLTLRWRTGGKSMPCHRNQHKNIDENEMLHLSKS